ncbi:MAG: hypothetical protein LQ342_000553 [Letrouitia transgressa]|nr:MAG: hypothetical protein LQ342_000553 [Letrouitia transgressa]
MRGFEWKDQRGVEGTGFVRALRSLMTPQLPLLLPTLKQTLEDEFDYQISGSKRSKDSVHLRIKTLNSPPQRFSIHKMFMLRLSYFGTFAIEDLCLHSECMGPLRQEQEQMFDDLDILNVNKLPLLDSFIKESSRLSTSDATLKPVEMFNGTRIDRGSWVCVPSRAIAHDSIYYRDPECFDGFRFADRSALKEGQNPSLFTDSNPRWMIWGYGSTAWFVFGSV